MEIKGYKAFNKDRTNRYGKRFEEHTIYQVEGPPSFGNKGHGIHFCKRLEDTLRYVPADEEEVSIAEITSLGSVAQSFDDYYGYYDLYSGNKVRIDRFLPREEIINMFLELPTPRVKRFLQTFLLTEEEIKLFQARFKGTDEIELALAYYQEKDKEAYTKRNEQILIKTRKEYYDRNN